MSCAAALDEDHGRLFGVVRPRDERDGMSLNAYD